MKPLTKRRSKEPVPRAFLLLWPPPLRPADTKEWAKDKARVAMPAACLTLEVLP